MDSHYLTLLLLFNVLLFTQLLNFKVLAEEPEPLNLYSDDGWLLNLEVDAYYKSVTNSDKSWLVLFYLSWCGHCIDYVPKYESVANSLQGWSKFVQVSAINCAKSSNLALCRSHNITLYPTLMFYPPHTKNTTLPNYVVDRNIMNDDDSTIKFVVDKVHTIFPQATANIENLASLDGKDVVGHQHPNRKSEDLVQAAAKDKLTDKPAILVTKQNSSVLYYEDLVYAVRYSLHIEIGGHQSIEGESLIALKQYVNVLDKYFPDSDQQISESLSSLAKFLNSATENTISSSLWTLYLHESKVMKHTKFKSELIRCRGSQSMYRGYPCSLWTLFHTLTMQAASRAMTDEVAIKEKKIKENEKLSYQVLCAMRSYVSHFFTCYDCREHFSQMAPEIELLSNKANKDSALWLWNAHNRVNKRLAGDGSEDPEFPKIQFPGSQLCPLCKNPKGLWDEEAVYDFLHSVYTDIKHRDSPDLKPRGGIVRLAEQGVGDVQSYRWSRMGLNKLDMSMCYALYFVSGAGIAVLFYFIVIRQRLYLRSRKSPKSSDRHSLLNSKPIY